MTFAHVLVFLAVGRVGAGVTMQEPRVVSVGLGDWAGSGPAFAAVAVASPPVEASQETSLDTPEAPQRLESSPGEAPASSEAAVETPPEPSSVDPNVAPDILAAVKALLGASAEESEATFALDDVAALGGGGDPCGLAALIAARLRADADLREHLARLPRDARSVANAVMVWDGAWVAARSVEAEAALAGVRGSLRTAMAGADAGCLQEAQAGPHLLTIAEDSSTTVLVVGSGDWRWSDVLATPDSKVSAGTHGSIKF